MKVVVNADDFGKSIEVNEAIEKCIQEGTVTSTTLMAGGGAFDDAIERIKKYPDISVGVHLHIDECGSLTKSQCFFEKGMIDENGDFVCGVFNRDSLSKSEQLVEAIYCEWNAQIEKIRSVGIIVSHLDSHHHIHTLPELKGVVARLMKDNQIDKVRLSYVKPFGLNGGRNLNSNHNIVKSNKLLQVYRKVQRRLERERWNKLFSRTFSTVDFFCPAQFFLLNKDWCEKKYKNGTIELMCHPGHPGYIEETNALEKCTGVGIQKINYCQL